MQVSCGVGAEKAKESCVWRITPRDRNATKELCEYKGVELLEGKACIDPCICVYQYHQSIQYQR